MAAVPIEAFLALEASLTQRLADTYAALTEKLLPAIQNAIEQEDWDKAQELVQQIDLDPVFELNKDFIEYVSNIAMLFGASRINDSAERSVVGFGLEKHTVQAMMLSLRQMIVVKGEETLKNAALQLIALKRNPSPPVAEPSYLGNVLKADKKSAVLPFASFMSEEGRAYFNIASSLHTSRLSAFGYTAEAQALGITRYAINEQLDGRVCEVCAFMHGKTFEVEDARGLLDLTIRTQDASELKMLQPWPSQSKAGMAYLKGLSSEEIVQQGWHVPPFHPRCRGLLVKAGKVPPLNQPAPAPEKEDYTASAEDFKQLGLQMPQEKIDLWNALMQTAPAEVVARLSTQPLEDILSALSTTDAPKSVLGLKSLSIGKNGINVELHKPLFGSKKLIKQDLYFRTDKSLFVGSVEFAKQDAKLFPKVLKNLYGTAKDAGMDSITAVAGSDSSGYAFAKYGFVPTTAQWKSLKKQIVKTLANTNMDDMMGATDKKALDLILKSDDPKSIFSMSDIPHLGKALLSGTSWTGTLNFADDEALKRFFSFLK